MSYAIIASSCPGCIACVKVCPVIAITGERKIPHTIEASRCIDCGACGRICPYQAILNDSGELCQMVKRSLWLLPLILEIKCVSCGVCLEICPTSVLDFVDLADFPAQPIAYLKDAPGCIGCSFCETACPVGAIEMQTGKTN